MHATIRFLDFKIFKFLYASRYTFPTCVPCPYRLTTTQTMPRFPVTSPRKKASHAALLYKIVSINSSGQPAMTSDSLLIIHFAPLQSNCDFLYNWNSTIADEKNYYSMVFSDQADMPLIRIDEIFSNCFYFVHWAIKGYLTGNLTRRTKNYCLATSKQERYCKFIVY